MRISSDVAGANLDSAVRTRGRGNSGARATQSAEANGVSAATQTPTTQAAQTSKGSTDAGPAATVTISNKARVALRAAGATPTEISRVNLSDKYAVQRAIQKARMSRAKAGANASGSTNTNGASGATSADAHAAPVSQTRIAVAAASSTEANDENSASAEPHAST
jgi:hypothetical protein